MRSKKLLTQTYVRGTIGSEQAFGVIVMIPTWTISNATHSANITPSRAARPIYTNDVPSRATKANQLSARAMNVRVRNRSRMWPAARIVFFLLAFALLFGGFTFMRSFASPEQAPPAAAAESVFVVDSGDTLWSVATAVKPSSMDTQRAVHMLVKRNQLQSTTLVAGQMLIIPAEMKPSD